MKKHSLLHRAIAVMLCFCMLLSGMSTPLSVVAAENDGATPDVVKRVADGDTTDDYIKALNLKDSSENVGRLWSDKSVFANSGANATVTLDMTTDGYNGNVTTDEDFLHVFSAQGSSLIGERTDPIDLVIVIDLSMSMTMGLGTDATQWENNQDKTRIYKLAKAIETSYHSLMDANDDSRIAIIGYGGNYTSLLPLGHYKTLSVDAYAIDYADSMGGGAFALRVEANGKDGTAPSLKKLINYPKSDAGGARMTSLYGQGGKWENDFFESRDTYAGDVIFIQNNTNLSAGIYRGLKELVDADVTTTENGVTRIPAAIVMTDGGANRSLNDYWYNPAQNDDNNPTKEDRTHDNFSDYTSKSEGDSASIILNALMTAAYMKSAVEEHYNTDAYIYTVGMDIVTNKDFAGLSGTAKDNAITSEIINDIGTVLYESRLLSTLDPKNYFYVNGEFNENTRELLKGKLDRELMSDYNWYPGYLEYDNWRYDEHIFPYKDPWKVGQATEPDKWSNAKLTSDADTHNPEWRNRKYTDSILDALDAWKLWMDFDEGEDEAVIDSGNAFINKDGTLTVNGITYQQKFATTVNGKKVMSDFTRDFPQLPTNDYSATGGTNALYRPAGAEWTVTKQDIIDNIAYADAFFETGNGLGIEDIFGNINQLLASKAFNPVDGTNDNGIANALTYKDPIGEYMELKDGSVTVGGSTYDISMLLNGKMYGLKKSAIGAAGNLPMTPDASKEYTLYEFDSSVKNTIFWNDAYGKAPDNLQTVDTDQVSGAYKLSDIVVWAEHNPSSGDDALYVNIPADAIPVQTVNVELDYNSANSTFVRNYDVAEGVTPIRFFYAVGLQNALIEDNKVNLDKVDPEYIENHTDDKGNVLFYSNYYSAQEYTYNRTEAYFTGGDPMVTFSPASENRYYIFQSPEMLYEFEGSNPPEVTITASEAGGALNQTALRKALVDKLKAEQRVQPVAEIDSNSTNKWYYVPLYYYMPKMGGNGEMVFTAVARKGSEFGSGIGSGTAFGTYVCWYNPDTNSVQEYTPGSTAPSGGNWYIAASTNALRTGDFGQSVEAKKNNITKTAENYYLPKVSNRSTLDDETFNVYLGNNGLLAVARDTNVTIVKEQAVNGGERTQDRLSVKNGDEVTYYLTVTNEGDTTAEAVIVSDEIPQTPKPLTLVEGSISDGGTLLADGKIIVWNLGDMAPKATKTVSFKVTVPAVEEDTIWTNFAIVSSADSDNPDDPSVDPNDPHKGRKKTKKGSNEVEIIETPAPRITIEKDQAVNGDTRTKELKEVKDGDEVTYYLTIKSVGELAAENVVVTDVIPQEPEKLTLVTGSISDSGNLLGDGKTIVWNLGKMEPNTEKTVSFTVTVPKVLEVTTWENIGKASFDDPNNPSPDNPDPNDPHKGRTPEDSNEVEIVEEVKDPNITIVKDQAVNDGDRTKELKEVEGGDEVTYYLTVTSNGEEVAEDVIVTDEIPEGLTLVEGSILVDGEIWEDIQINGDTIIWMLGDMEAGDSKTLSFTVTVPIVDDVTTWTNFARVSRGGPDNPDDPSADPNDPHKGRIRNRSNEVDIQEIPGVPNVTIAKDQSVNGGTRTKELKEVKDGDEVTYYLTVKSDGEVTAKDVVVTDEIPSGLTLVTGSISNSGKLLADGKTIAWNLGNMAPGASTTVSFKVSVPKVTKETTWTNFGYVSNQDPKKPDDSGTGGSGTNDPHKGRTDTKKKSNEVQIKEDPGIPNVTIAKDQSVNGGTRTTELQKVEGGNEVTYYLTITSDGTAVAEDVIVTDEIPSGLTLVTGSISNNGKLLSDGKTIVWSLGNMAPGDKLTVSFKVTAPTVDKETTWTNFGYVSNKDPNKVDVPGSDGSDAGDPHKGRTSTKKESNKVQIKETPSSPGDPSVTIEKAQSVNGGKRTTAQKKVKGGDEVTYYLIVKSDGDSVAKNVVVTDKVPKGLTLVKGSISNDGTLLDDGKTIVWKLGNMEPNDSITVSFTVKVPSVSKTTYWENIGEVSYDDPSNPPPTNPDPDDPHGGRTTDESNEVEIVERGKDPKTGDDWNAMLWFTLFAASAGAFGVLSFKKSQLKKKERKDK